MQSAGAAPEQNYVYDALYRLTHVRDANNALIEAFACDRHELSAPMNRISWFANFCIALIGLGGCSYLDQPNTVRTTFYTSLEQNERDDLMTKGWLPVGLPENADQIYLTRDLDSGEFWIRLRASLQDQAFFLHYCKPSKTILNKRDKDKIIEKAPWWPLTLAQKNISQSTDFDLFHCPALPHKHGPEEINIALSSSDAMVYYWRN